MKKEIRIGNTLIGGANKIAIQSMTNTKTSNVEKTVLQINELEKAGCEIIRVAVLDNDAASAIKEIKKQIHIPIVADIHFDYKLAIASIENGADKIRINPGNIGSIENIKQVVNKAKEYDIPIRVGVNGGSLAKDVLSKYGKVTVNGLVESAYDNVKILEDTSFEESGHLTQKGSLDMNAIIKALVKTGFDGYVRPDHGRMIWGETGKPGYGLFDRALGATYINGLFEALEKELKK